MRFKSSALSALLPTAGVLLALTASTAHAQIVNSGPVNGLATFTDTNTGLVWVDLNNFFDKSYNEMKATVEAAGFTVADVTQVHGLLDNLPLDSTGANWDTYAAIMGRAPNRELIWGAYLPEANDVSWAYAYRFDTSWNFAASTGVDFNSVPNGGTDAADMNIWAYQTSTSTVPEPSSIALLAGLGVTGSLFAVRRLRRRK